MAGLTSMTVAVAAIAPRRWKKPPLIKRALAALVAGARRRGLSRARARHHRGELDPRVGGLAARRRSSSRRSSRRTSSAAGGDRRGHRRKPVDDGGRPPSIGIALSIPVGIGAAKNIAPAPVYYFCRGILAVSRSFQEIILAIFFVKLFGFGPFAGVRDAVLRHHRLLRQAARRGHRGHGPGAGRGGARDRRGLAAMDQLRRAAAGDAAHDRARPLPLRHQLPRIRRGRHRRRRRHRRHAQHRVRPLRVRFRRRHPAGHHRHRDGGGIFAPAISGAGCSDGDAITDGTQGLAAPRPRARNSRSGRRGSSASRSSSIAGS